MKHRHPSSEDGRTSLSDVISALKAKGVQPVHKVTRLRPEIIEDPEGVAEFMKNHNPAPLSVPLTRDQVETEAKQTVDVGMLEGQNDDLTEEELFRIRRRAAREKLREREET